MQLSSPPLPSHLRCAHRLQALGFLGALGGTLGDPCSLLGVKWVLPGYIGGI